MSAKRSFVLMIFAGASFFGSDACAQRMGRVGTLREPTAIAADSTLLVRRFVQEFYDWYAPLALGDHYGAAWWNVLKNADRYLDRSLASAVRDDSIARMRDPQTREVLNFDPFLNSQDPCVPYEVISVHHQGGTYRVPMRACHAKGAGPVVEVRAVDGRWKITNVFYGRGDLKSALCQWAKEETRTDKRPAKCY